MRIIIVCLILLVSALYSNDPALANDTAESATRLLILGDSLTSGYGLVAEEAFPVQLEKTLQAAGHKVTVINAGVTGDTTAGGLSRLEWALADSPRMVVVALGGNDALRGLPPEVTYANLDTILTRLNSADLQVLLVGMKAPRNLGEDYTRAFDQIYPQLASKHKVGFYPFFLDGVALDPALNQVDGIHPNAKGVRVIVERMLPTLQELLGEQAAIQ